MEPLHQAFLNLSKTGITQNSLFKLCVPFLILWTLLVFHGNLLTSVSIVITQLLYVLILPQWMSTVYYASRHQAVAINNLGNYLQPIIFMCRFRSGVADIFGLVAFLMKLNIDASTWYGTRKVLSDACCGCILLISIFVLEFPLQSTDFQIVSPLTFHLFTKALFFIQKE